MTLRYVRIQLFSFCREIFSGRRRELIGAIDVPRHYSSNRRDSAASTDEAHGGIAVTGCRARITA